MNQQKKAIKICCDGDTKRLKITGNYGELINRTRESFSKKDMSDDDFKFFYLDDEHEVISITSQADLTEALNIEDLASLKLTVAANMQQAQKILQEQESMAASISQSISQSQLGAGPMLSSRSRANSAHPIVQQNPHGIDEEVKSDSRRKEQLGGMAGLQNFQRQATNDCDSSYKGSAQDVMSSDQQPVHRPSGVMVVGGNQMRKDREGVIPCCACKGSKLNSKGKKPCKTCKGKGLLPVAHFEGLFSLIKEELADYMERGMREVMLKYTSSEQLEKKEEIGEKVVESKPVAVEEAVPAADPAPPVNPILEVTMVSESFSNQFVVLPGQRFTKKWVFQNSGADAWPQNVRLGRADNGDELHVIGQYASIEDNQVQSGENYELELEFQAPEQPNNYITYYHLETPAPEKKQFGMVLWCGITVLKQEDQPDEEVKQEEPQPAEPAQPKPLPGFEEEVKEPTEQEKYAQLVSSAGVNQMDFMTLYEFGFTDFLVNEHLLTKFKDVSIVADMLLNGQVDDATIKQIYESARNNNQNRQ